MDFDLLKQFKSIDDNNNRQTPSRDGGTLGNSGLSGSGPSSNRMMDGSSSNHDGAAIYSNIDLEHEVAIKILELYEKQDVNVQHHIYYHMNNKQ